MAIAIGLAMIALAVGPIVALGAVGWVLRRQWTGALVGAGVGVAVGVASVTYVFFWEDITRPELVVDVPPGFDRDWVVLIEDPTASTEIEWSGGLTPKGRIAVGVGGVERVRSLQRARVGGVEVRLSTGASASGGFSRPAPDGLRGSTVSGYGFVDFGQNTEPDLTLMDEPDFVDRILQLEALASS